MAERTQVKITLNPKDMERLKLVKEWLGVSADAEVFRVLVRRAVAKLENSENPLD